MNQPLKQHLIDPEICIRCHTCEEACPIGAITHNDDNVVVNADKCEHCLDCIAPCPTGSIDNWRVVTTPYSVEEQLGWFELPEQEELGALAGADDTVPRDETANALLDAAHSGAGGRAIAPATASKPVENLFRPDEPLVARVQGNFRLTDEASGNDVRHIILDLGTVSLGALEGQSVGVIAPGQDANGHAHRMRLYTMSSPRDGERKGMNNLSLTVKRDGDGICSNYLCDLKRDDTVQLCGPFGGSFLIPNQPDTRLIMVCTGTGSAPFRAFTMRRQRENADVHGTMKLFFGARTQGSLPYFGPLGKVPQSFLEKHFAFSREPEHPKIYVQDRLREDRSSVGQWLKDSQTHIFVCGLKAMEPGVDSAFADIATAEGLDWADLKRDMLGNGRYHVETY